MKIAIGKRVQTKNIKILAIDWRDHLSNEQILYFKKNNISVVSLYTD